MKELIKENIYSNLDLQNIFKCSPQGGIRVSKQTNSIVLVAAWNGHAYNNKWTDNGIIYQASGFGEGILDRYQNKAVIQAQEQGRQIHLFERYAKNTYVYRGLLELVDIIERVEDGVTHYWFNLRPLRLALNSQYQPLFDIGVNITRENEYWQLYAHKRAFEVNVSAQRVHKDIDLNDWSDTLESLWREYADHLLSVFSEELTKYGREMGYEIVVPYYVEVKRGSVWGKLQIALAIAASVTTIVAKYPEAKAAYPELVHDIEVVIERARVSAENRIHEAALKSGGEKGTRIPIQVVMAPMSERRRDIKSSSSKNDV